MIIGILATVAIPRFANLTSNAKVSSELSTASAVETAIESAHSEWIVSDYEFRWGYEIDGSEKYSNCANSDMSDDNDFNCSKGYPNKLGVCPNKPFAYILKNSEMLKWSCEEINSTRVEYFGPASNMHSGVEEDNNSSKPDENDCWVYNQSNGRFALDENCTQ